MSETTAVAERALALPHYERLPARVWWLSSLMIVIGVVTFYLMSTQARSNGYLYLAFYSIPANTAISVFPHEPVLIFYGKFANLWLSALAATAGTLVAGFLDHRVFVPVLNYTKIISYKRSRFYRKATDVFMRYPFATLLITGFTPVPFFPFKFLCFSIQYPLRSYLAALTLARYPRYFLLAWIGATFGIPTWILIASVVVVFALYAIRGIPTVLRHIKVRRQAATSGAVKSESLSNNVSVVTSPKDVPSQVSSSSALDRSP